MAQATPGDTPAGAGGGFVRAITLTDATMLVAGSMIGSGIFIVSADIGRTVGTPFLLLASWFTAGVITLLGALVYGELAAMYPRPGGQYVFLHESLGPLTGFLYGWTLFTVIQTGTIAAVAVAFGRFAGVLWPGVTPERYGWLPHVDLSTPGGLIQMGLSPQRLVALGSIGVLTWINLRGVREGKTVQTTLTLVKTAALAGLILLGLTVALDARAVAANFGGGGFFAPHALPASLVTAFGAALVGSLFASDAWHDVAFAAAEVREPRRNLPRALLYGTGLVCLLYLLTNVSYLCILPLSGTEGAPTVLERGIQHAAEDRVGSAAGEAMFGPTGGAVMAVVILIATFGCNNGLILAGARVIYAMACDGLFFARAAGRLNSRGVPGVALVLQGLWAGLLCLTGTYGQLLDYVVFAALVFYVMTTLGLFVLRWRQPGALRPYRVVGYPVLPALYMLLAGGVAVILLLAPKTQAQALSGLVLVLLGIPVYLLQRRLGRSRVS